MSRKHLVRLLFLCLCISRILHAQSAVDTAKWLVDFITSNGGSEKDTLFEPEVVSQTTKSIMPLADVRRVETWHHPYGDGLRYFVRVSGTAYDCQGVDEWNGVREIRSKCSPKASVIDIELLENLSHGHDNANRMVTAIIHLAEQNGAKVNQKELF